MNLTLPPVHKRLQSSTLPSHHHHMQIIQQQQQQQQQWSHTFLLHHLHHPDNLRSFLPLSPPLSFLSLSHPESSPHSTIITFIKFNSPHPFSHHHAYLYHHIHATIANIISNHNHNNLIILLPQHSPRTDDNSHPAPIIIFTPVTAITSSPLPLSPPPLFFIT